MAKRKRTTQPTASALPEPTGPVLVSTPEEARALIRRTSARKKQHVVYTEDSLPDGDERTGLVTKEKEKEEDAFDGPLSEVDDDEPTAKGSPKAKKPRRRRAKASDEPVVYDIPPVETKETTYKGRLGYACLNTILRALKPEPVFCSRTLRIDTILKPEFGMDYCKGLGRRNAEDLARLIQVRSLRFRSRSSGFCCVWKGGKAE